MAAAASLAGGFSPSRHHHPSSPGPAYSDCGTPTRGGGFGSPGGGSLFDTLRRGLRAESPLSSVGGGSDAAGTPKGTSRLFPSFTNGQRKREVIRKLEDDVAALASQAQQREGQLARLAQQLAAEEALRAEAQERMNMQVFKANLVADMLVARLLDPPSGSGGGGGGNGGAAAPLPARGPVGQGPAAKEAAAAPAPGTAAGLVEESSFD